MTRKELWGRQCQQKASTFIWLQAFCDSVPNKVTERKILEMMLWSGFLYERRRRGLARLLHFSSPRAWACALTALMGLHVGPRGGTLALEVWGNLSVSKRVWFYRSPCVDRSWKMRYRSKRSFRWIHTVWGGDCRNEGQPDRLPCLGPLLLSDLQGSKTLSEQLICCCFLVLHSLPQPRNNCSKGELGPCQEKSTSPSKNLSP